MDLREKALTLLSTTVVDMETDQKNALFTVPAGKKCIVTHVVVREPSATLVGGTEYDLGDDANCTTWVQDTNLATLTDTNHQMMIHATGLLIVFAALAVFGIRPVSGSNDPANATIDVFGYLFDA